ncbi:MAG: hypothetical protein ACI4F4_03405 [Lachnospiraceae bacterium]
MDDIVRNILQLNFKEAKKICDKAEYDLLRGIILKESYETSYISFILFVQYMVIEDKREFWTDLLIECLIGPFCHLDGAYLAAYYLSKKVLQEKKSVSNYEQILFFANVPEISRDVLSNTEIKEYASELLKLDSKNKIAQRILYGY